MTDRRDTGEPAVCRHERLSSGRVRRGGQDRVERSKNPRLSSDRRRPSRRSSSSTTSSGDSNSMKSRASSAASRRSRRPSAGVSELLDDFASSGREHRAGCNSPDQQLARPARQVISTDRTDQHRRVQDGHARRPRSSSSSPSRSPTLPSAERRIQDAPGSSGSPASRRGQTAVEGLPDDSGDRRAALPRERANALVALIVDENLQPVRQHTHTLACACAKPEFHWACRCIATGGPPLDQPGQRTSRTWSACLVHGPERFGNGGRRHGTFGAAMRTIVRHSVLGRTRMPPSAPRPCQGVHREFPGTCCRH